MHINYSDDDCDHTEPECDQHKYPNIQDKRKRVTELDFL